MNLTLKLFQTFLANILSNNILKFSYSVFFFPTTQFQIVFVKIELFLLYKFSISEKSLAIPRIGGDLNYKIPLVALVPKVTKFIFYNISSSLLVLSAQNIFGKTKVCGSQKKLFFNGKPKMTKK